MRTTPLDWLWALVLFGGAVLVPYVVIGLAVVVGWVANSMFGRVISDSFR